MLTRYTTRCRALIGDAAAVVAAVAVARPRTPRTAGPHLPQRCGIAAMTRPQPVDQWPELSVRFPRFRALPVNLLDAHLMKPAAKPCDRGRVASCRVTVPLEIRDIQSLIGNRSSDNGVVSKTALSRASTASSEINRRAWHSTTLALRTISKMPRDNIQRATATRPVLMKPRPSASCWRNTKMGSVVNCDLLLHAASTALSRS